MCKAEEIEILRETIAKLGPNSYCGPWLASVADEVEQQVRSDFFPTPSIAATRKECVSLIELATKAVAQIEADARTKADKAIRETENRISGIRDRAGMALRAALQQLEERL